MTAGYVLPVPVQYEHAMQSRPVLQSQPVAHAQQPLQTQHTASMSPRDEEPHPPHEPATIEAGLAGRDEFRPVPPFPGTSSPNPTPMLLLHIPLPLLPVSMLLLHLQRHRPMLPLLLPILPLIVPTSALLHPPGDHTSYYTSSNSRHRAYLGLSLWTMASKCLG